MIIWLDDLRDPRDYGYPDAVWVKEAIEFKFLLIECLINDDGNSIEEIHFDNDIGEKTEGYDLFLLVEQGVHGGKFKSLKRVFVHTSNPGAANKFMLAKESMARYGVTILRKNY